MGATGDAENLHGGSALDFLVCSTGHVGTVLQVTPSELVPNSPSTPRESPRGGDNLAPIRVDPSRIGTFDPNRVDLPVPARASAGNLPFGRARALGALCATHGVPHKIASGRTGPLR